MILSSNSGRILAALSLYMVSQQQTLSASLGDYATDEASIDAVVAHGLAEADFVCFAREGLQPDFLIEQ